MADQGKSKDVVQQEALAAVRSHRRSGIAVSMGVGKTLIALMHMAENYTETSMFLVVAPKLSVFTTYKEEAVRWGYEYLLPHINFTTYLSMDQQSLEYDILYLDECHSLLYSHDFWLNAYPGKIVGMTGTPPKHKTSEKGKMVAKYCPIVYTYITDEAVSDGLLNDYRIVVHKLHLDQSKSLVMKNKKGGSWMSSEQISYDYWTDRLENAVSPKDLQIMRVMRMNALKNFPSKERYAKKLFDSINGKCLLFVNTQEQADKMCSHSYHSENPNSDWNLGEFKAGNITKLTSVLQLNEGVNIPELRYGIIMHAYGNERKSSQRIGRLLRLNPDDVATIHILCYVNTVDERWVKEALADLDQSKISWVNPMWTV